MLSKIVRAFRRPTAADVSGIDLLSKDDAQNTFRLSRSAWNRSVLLAEEFGSAKASGNPETGLTLLKATPHGILGVKPDYDTTSDAPDFIVVSVTYPTPTCDLLTDAQAAEVLQTTARQMEPEFAVSGNVERGRDSLAIYFMITKAPLKIVS